MIVISKLYSSFAQDYIITNGKVKGNNALFAVVPNRIIEKYSKTEFKTLWRDRKKAEI